ncbi:unnamed protein product [Heterobilharzia americana]|nr:unnamed protein product [Heterobilharzia americana]
MHKTRSAVGIHSYHSDLHKQSLQDVLTTNSTVASELHDANNSVIYVNGCCSGLTMDLLMELMKDLNFDVEMYEVMDGFWGAWTPDGWNGIIRDLMDNRADMAVTSLKITPNRSQQIEFSVPFLETGIAVTVALREGAIAPTAFLKPYDYQCWCVILVFSVHATGAALYIYEWFSPNGMNRGRSPDQTAVNADNPRGMASRFMANIWALFALVFLASYTANLAAFMIAKEDYFELSGINDWRLQHPWNVKPPFRFATIPSGATEENIKINFPEMHKYMRKFNKSSVEEGLRAMKSGQLDAFLYDANVLDYWAMKDEGCKLRTVGNLYAMTGYGIGFTKSSRWLTKVNSRILDYQKNGKLQRWKKFWQTGSCKKDAAVGNANKTLGVKNFISAFILLVCGMLICTVFLLIEYTVYWYAKPKLTKLNQHACFGRFTSTMKHAPRLPEQVNLSKMQTDKIKCGNPICDMKTKNYLKELQILRIQLDKLQESLKKKNSSVNQHMNSLEYYSRDKTMVVNPSEYPRKKKRTDSVNHYRPTNCEEHESNMHKSRIKIHSSTKSLTDNSAKTGGIEKLFTPITMTTTTPTASATAGKTSRKNINHWTKCKNPNVTIIPITNQHNKHEQSDNHHELSTNGTETKYVILPKLDSSPNRRRRFIKPESRGSYSLSRHRDINYDINSNPIAVTPATTSVTISHSVMQTINQIDTNVKPVQNDFTINFTKNQTVGFSLNTELKLCSSLTSILGTESGNLTFTDLDQQHQQQIKKCLVEKESVL